MPTLAPRVRSNPLPAARPVNPLVLRFSMLGRKLAGVAQGVTRMPAPRFGVVAVVVLGATGIYGVAVGGRSQAIIDGVSQALGLSIETIDVTGNRETSEIDVLQALWQTGAASLPALDPQAAREILEAMPWIETASVAKIYPDRVAIRLVERQPFALWQRGRELFVVDREGREIVPYASRFATLPLVVGTGAGETAAELLDRMEVLPELRARVKAYIRVGDRRWDLRLENGVTIRLPEEQATEAAAEVARLDRDVGLLSRDIAAVDMRIEDRMVIKLTPEAFVRRNAALKERDKIVARNRKENPV